jgi:hypothetical protein
VAKATKRASGFNPSADAFSADMTITAAAPSEVWDELPAVTEPPSLKAGRSLASASRVVSARGPSSRLTVKIFWSWVCRPAHRPSRLRWAQSQGQTVRPSQPQPPSDASAGQKHPGRRGKCRISRPHSRRSDPCWYTRTGLRSRKIGIRREFVAGHRHHRHRLSPACDGDLQLPSHDRIRDMGNRLHAGRTIAVDGLAADSVRQPGSQAPPSAPCSVPCSPSGKAQPRMTSSTSAGSRPGVRRKSFFDHFRGHFIGTNRRQPTTLGLPNSRSRG